MGMISQVKGFFQGGEAHEKRGFQRAIAEVVNLLELAKEDAGWERASGGETKLTPRTRNSLVEKMNRNQKRFEQDGRIKQGVNLHANFTLGNGIGLPKAKNPAIQEHIKQFWNDPTNQRNLFGFPALQTRHREFQLGGEINLLVKVDVATGRSKVYVAPIQNVMDVATDPDDPSRPAFYSIRTQHTPMDLLTGKRGKTEEKTTVHRALRYKLYACTEEEFSRGLVFHVGQNELFGQLRGASDLDAVVKAEDTATEMAADGATLSKANAEVAFKNKILKGGKATADKLLSILRTRSDGSNPNPPAGSDWYETEASERKWMTERDTGAAYREKDQRMVLLPVFAGLGFGEHYFGDASTGNLATATSMELPVLKMSEGEQKFWEWIFTELVKFSLEIKVALGVIPGEVVEYDEFNAEPSVDAAFTIDFPPILRKDINPYTQAVCLAVDKGLIGEEDGMRLLAQAFGIDDADDMIKKLMEVPQPETPPTGSETKPKPGETPAQPGETKPPAGGTPPQPGEKTAEQIAGGNGKTGGKYTSVKFV